MIDITKIKSVYLIGIGGVGMSALAQYFFASGCKVSGFDRAHSAITEMLENNGITVYYLEDINHIPTDVDLVIYTPAIKSDNTELYFAMNYCPTVLKRSEVLELICKNQYCIAVAGTHGKTTITSMIAHILDCSDIKANAFIGGISKNAGTNIYMHSGSRVVVVEADEYDRSFLKLNPQIVVVNAVDPDHLDVYKDCDDMIEAYQEFVNSCDSNKRIINIKYSDKFDDAFTYGFGKDANIKVVSYNYTNNLADVVINDGVKDIQFSKLPLYGKHNIENFCAAFAVADMLKIDTETVQKAMREYKGVVRRFDIKFESKDIVYIDDYAHHPVEIETLYNAVKEVFTNKRSCIFFQPHLYSRTQYFMPDLARVLSKFDEVYLLDIYAAREKPMQGVSSEVLAEMIDNQYCEVIQKKDVLQKVKESKANLFLTVGAGDIDRLVVDIQKELSKKYNE